MHGPAFERGAAGYRSPPGNDGVLRHVPQELVIGPAGGDQVILAVGFELPDDRPVCVAEASGGGDDRVQHRLQLGGRAADDAENLAGRSLSFQRLTQFLRPLLDLLIQAAQLRARAVDVGGERAQLVAVPDIDAPGELAGRNLAQPPRDPGQRPHDRPREHVTETQRQNDAAERDADDDYARGVVGLLARLDPLEHAGLGHVHQLVGEALETIGERPGFAQLQLARLVDLAGAGRSTASVTIAIKWS